MLTVSPFRALMPPPDRAAQVAAVPYDVVDTAEARRLAEGNPCSFLHVSRPDVDLADDADIHGEVAYAAASAAFEKLCREAPLVHDTEPCYYIYSAVWNGRRQSGLAAALAVDDYDEGRIQQHERTRPDKVEDRTNHLMATRTHSGPVFLVCRSNWSMDATIQEVMANHAPLFDTAAEDGTVHQVWRVPHDYDALLAMVFKKGRALYIADGHHRAKSASEARKRCRDANPGHSGDEAYNHFLGVIFPHNQVKILAYNRAVKDLLGMAPELFLERIGKVVPVTPCDNPVPERQGVACMYLGGKWYQLDLASLPAAANPADNLDVSRLQHHVLEPLLGIDDPRTSKRIDFVGGIRGTDWLAHLVDSGRSAVAFSMFPTTIDELIAISEAGEIMPPKSTWFEPKLRDGLLIHSF